MWFTPRHWQKRKWLRILKKWSSVGIWHNKSWSCCDSPHLSCTWETVFGRQTRKYKSIGVRWLSNYEQNAANESNVDDDSGDFENQRPGFFSDNNNWKKACISFRACRLGRSRTPAFPSAFIRAGWFRPSTAWRRSESTWAPCEAAGQSPSFRPAKARALENRAAAGL